MVSRKRGKLMPRRAGSDLKNGNVLISGDSFGISSQKAVCEKDFPSLGSEDRQGVPDTARVSSPSLSSSVQSLPVGSSAFIVGEVWTLALAEVNINEQSIWSYIRLGEPIPKPRRGGYKFFV
ncbi:C-JUN-AMINO-TERMINAL KINASE-INTERACTING PROTEIN [Salix viminalis]|uniref:C-JUN-AMINO-TERMINAL KINASE-INTERACTING PROTEIN n=1 Tax=Salix viminalis TaxID=40686 RepID=A0A9Q0ZQ30_SALVM|nr:C-JUN-AMINO-TERMINAL KINASE-INTERACTING PROTEIN [Salix viminalis]